MMGRLAEVAATPPTPAGWLVPAGLATASALLAALAWTLVTTRELRDPTRDLRQPWRPSWRAVRLPLEALIVGVATLLATWWARLADAFGYPQGLSAQQVLTVGAGVACVGAAALVGLVWIRSGRVLLLPGVLGMAAWAAGGLTAVVADVAGDPPLWSIALLIGSLPLTLAGLSTVDTGDFDGTPDAIDRAEHRDTVAATTATVTSIGVVMFALPLDRTREPEPMSAVLVVLLIALFAVREAVNAFSRVQLTRRLHDQAVHDQLTGLTNRRGLAQALDRLDRRLPWVVVVLDLDEFERVNDELGHQAGDALLVALADHLAARCPAPRVVARLGGDEFAVVSPGDLESGRRLAHSLRGAVRDAVQGSAAGLPVTASIGVGRLRFPTDDTDPDTPADEQVDAEPFHSFAAVAEASAALRAAKSDGHDRIEIYAGRTERARRRRLAVERRLRATLADPDLLEQAITVQLQPIVRLDLDRAPAQGDDARPVIHGFEALARWTDPELGVVPPGEFVTVAEQTGVIVPLGAHLLRTTLTQAARSGYFGTGLDLAINVSPLQLRAPGFADLVLQLIEETGASPAEITLELTEAVLLDEDDAGLPALARLVRAGVQLAIDDFGTGHAALAYLRRLPLNVLKIDRSLTGAALRDARSMAVVKGMIRLAERLGITVVMEGIEDAETARMCRDLGAGLGQGWYFGAAAPWDHAEALSAAANAPDREAAR